jgi:hypothetical protein
VLSAGTKQTNSGRKSILGLLRASSASFREGSRLCILLKYAVSCR